MLFTQPLATVRNGVGGRGGLLAGQGWSAEVDTLSSPEWDSLTSAFADMALDQTAAGVDETWGRGRVSRR